jgi:hypothetical protein
MQLYQNNIQDKYGNAIAGASVRVVDAVTGTLAVLYSDNGTTPLFNPITVGGKGEFAFYAPNGRYTFTATSPGVQVETVVNFEMADSIELKDAVTAGAASAAANAGLTELDRAATAADRVQTGQDRTAAADSATTASTQAGIATTKAGEALASKGAIDTAIATSPSAAAVVVNLAAPGGSDLIGHPVGDVRATLTTAAAKLRSDAVKLDHLTLPLNRIVKGLRGVSGTGTFGSYTPDKATNGNYTLDSAADSGWLATSSTFYKSITLDMPFGVTIGDSIAEGHPNAHGRLHTSAGAVDLAMLNVVGQMSYHLEQFTRCKVYNHGIGGQTTAQVLARFNRDVLGQVDGALTPTSTLPRKASWMVLVCGINDVFGGVTAATIKTNLNTLITTALTNDVRPIVFNIGPHSSMDVAKLAVVKEVNAWLAMQAASNAAISVVDFYTYANDPANDGKPITGVFADGVHPTRHHFERLARKAIDESLGSTAAPVIPRWLNFSTAINWTQLPGSYARPRAVMLHADGIPVSLHILPNAPDACLPVRPPSGVTFCSQLTVEILAWEVPIEHPTSTPTYTGFSEIYLTDKHIFAEHSDARAHLGYTSEIVPLPVDTEGVVKGAFVVPSATTAGNVAFAGVANATNVLGTFAINTTMPTAYVCVGAGKLALFLLDGTVYPGDLLVTTASSRFVRSTSPAVGTVVGRVIFGGVANGFAVGTLGR